MMRLSKHLMSMYHGSESAKYFPSEVLLISHENYMWQPLLYSVLRRTWNQEGWGHSPLGEGLPGMQTVQSLVLPKQFK